MISRLFLVGIVGVLGVSFPDGTGWGIGLPRAPTEVATAHPTPRTAVAFEPIAVVEDPGNRIAEELNRRSEGLDIPTAPIAKARTSRREEFAPSPAGGAVELKLMAELCRVAEEAEVHGAADEGAIDELFGGNRVWSEPTPALESRPTFEPIAVADDASSVVDELNRVHDGMNVDIIGVKTFASRRQSFEPIAPVETASDVADAMNGASDGQSIAPAADRSLATALRLTRNAALAWMSVLTRATSSPITTR